VVFDQAKLARQTYLTVEELAAYVYGESAKRMKDPVAAAHEMVRGLGLRKLRWGRRVLVSRADVDRQLAGGRSG
jgi:hypothetical protein